MSSSLNSIQSEELPKFVKVLNDYIESGMLEGVRLDFSNVYVQSIEITGCDDAVVRTYYLTDGISPTEPQRRDGESISICSETTFKEILDLLIEQSYNYPRDLRS